MVAWLSVRAKEGTFILRVEDLDEPRAIPGMGEAAEEDLCWIGLDWDEGPGKDGPFGPYIQASRISYYEEALKVLHDRGYLFPCAYSRKDLRELASAPHGAAGVSPYPVHLRPDRLEAGWFEDMQRESRHTYAAIRFKVPDDLIYVHDLIYGSFTENVRASVGDFVLKRKDGLFAYQLAVVVDDLAMQVNEVVRGTDLITSTARQILLIRALGGSEPRYAHVPLMLNAGGEKLSKRDESLTVRAIREAGVRPEQLVGYLACSIGLIGVPRALPVTELISSFTWDRIHKEDWVIPEDVVAELKAIR